MKKRTKTLLPFRIVEEQSWDQFHQHFMSRFWTEISFEPLWHAMSGTNVPKYSNQNRCYKLNTYCNQSIWQNEIGKKAARKMLVNLTLGNARGG